MVSVETPTLAICIVSYNTQELTLQATHSVWKDVQSTTKLKNATQLWIIDNNSSDDSVQVLESWRTQLTASEQKQIRIKKNKENLGFAQANNQMLTAVEADYYFLLNSDTITPTGTLESLLATFEQHPLNQPTAVLSSESGKLDRLGIISPLLLNSDGSIQPQGGDLPSLTSLAAQMLFLDDIPVLGSLLPSIQHTGKNQKNLQSQLAVAQCGWVAGTAMLLRKEVRDEIGLLDENIFMYAEDIEYCLRAQHHHFDCGIVPTAQITHLQSASSTSQSALIGELLGLKYIWAKHFPFWQHRFAEFLLFTGARLRKLVFTHIKPLPERVAAYEETLDRLQH